MNIRLKRQKKESFERRKAEDADHPRVFSYYARGNSNNSQNIGRHEPVNQPKTRSYKRLVYIPSYIALCLLVTAGLYTCWLQPAPRIVVLSKEGTVTRSSQDYQIGIASIWRRSILNQTKLTVHAKDIKNDILGQYGEISNVQIELPLIGRRPTIVLTPAMPAMQYITKNGSFYVNTVGKVMVKTSDVAQNQLQNLPLVRDESGIAAEVDKNIIPEFEAMFLQKLSAHFAQEDIKIDTITLPAVAANEADVRVAGQSYYVKFSVIGDPRQSIGAYKAVKAKLDNDHVIPKEYIDVRVDEKVFYK